MLFPHDLTSRNVYGPELAEFASKCGIIFLKFDSLSPVLLFSLPLYL
jgi:hypothetical protein